MGTLWMFFTFNFRRALFFRNPPHSKEALPQCNIKRYFETRPAFGFSVRYVHVGKDPTCQG